jgi:lincosamide nucleotidyltransferase
MLRQTEMIEQVRQLCQRDERVSAAMMYGSFTRGEGDGYSDIEFLLFFEDAAFDALDRRAWLEAIAPVALMYVNDFGITAVIFDNLVRGEFHFHRATEVKLAEAWRGVIAFPSLETMLLVDKAGLLTPLLEPLIGPDPARNSIALVQALADDFANQYLFGVNVLLRGEHARALEMLGVLQRLILRLARVEAGKTGPWFIPSRRLELDLDSDAYARFQRCTARLDATELRHAYLEVSAWANDLLGALQARHGIEAHAELRARITARLHNARPPIP